METGIVKDLPLVLLFALFIGSLTSAVRDPDAARVLALGYVKRAASAEGTALVSERGPVVADLTGGFTKVADLKGTVDGIRASLDAGVALAIPINRPGVCWASRPDRWP